MGIKDYNEVQMAIIKKYQLLSLLTIDKDKFNYICELFAKYRQLKRCYTTTKYMIKSLKAVN